MTPENARLTVLQLYSHSQFFRGLVLAKEAWSLGFPDKDNDKEQLENLIKLFIEIGTSLERLKNESNS